MHKGWRFKAALGFIVTLIAPSVQILLAGCHHRHASPPPAVETDAKDSDLQKVATRLVQTLREGNDEESEDAGSALVALGAPVIPALTPALDDAREGVRLAIVEVLARIGTTQAVEPLLAALQDESWDVRLEAVEALGSIGDRSAVRPLMERYQRDEDPQVRYECLTSLVTIGDPMAAELLTAETENEDPYARAWALDALCRMRDRKAPVLAVALLDDANQWVRRRALRSCDAALNSVAAEDVLIRAAIHDSDFDNSVFARRLLRTRLQETPDRDSLLRRMREAGRQTLQDKTVQQAQRIQAAYLLAETGDREASETLAQAINDPRMFVRQHAVYLMGQLGDERAVPALVRALQDSEQLVQATAYESLRQFAETGNQQAQAAVQRDGGPSFGERLTR